MSLLRTGSRSLVLLPSLGHVLLLPDRHGCYERLFVLLRAVRPLLNGETLYVLKAVLGKFPARQALNGNLAVRNRPAGGSPASLVSRRFLDTPSPGGCAAGVAPAAQPVACDAIVGSVASACGELRVDPPMPWSNRGAHREPVTKTPQSAIGGFMRGAARRGERCSPPPRDHVLPQRGRHRSPRPVGVDSSRRVRASSFRIYLAGGRSVYELSTRT